MEQQIYKNSIRVIGIDSEKLYEILFISQGSDRSFYYGLCMNEDTGHYSRHKSGRVYLQPPKKYPLKKEDKPFMQFERLPLTELNHNESFPSLTLSVEGIKQDDKPYGMKEYKNKKFDGIFALDLRKFSNCISIHTYLVPDKSKIDDVLKNDLFKEGEFYLFTKTNPNLLLVAYPS